MSDLTVLRADRWVDIDAGEVRSPALITIQGNRIASVDPADVPASGTASAHRPGSLQSARPGPWPAPQRAPTARHRVS